MARATADILKEMIPLIDSTYTVRAKWRLLSSFGSSVFPAEDLKNWFQSAIGVSGAVSEPEAKTKLLANYKFDAIDPLTRFDIFETVMWPKISSYSPGWADHPEDKFPPAMSTMKGVVFKEIYKLGGSGAEYFTYSFQKLFGKHIQDSFPANGFLDQTSQLAMDFKNLKKLSEELGENFDYDLKGTDGDKVNNRKVLVNTLFSNDNAVKLWFIEYVLLSGAYASPFSCMGIDPYFGYLLAFVGWKGGADAFTTIKGKVTLDNTQSERTLQTVVDKAAYGQWDGSSSVNWYTVVKGTDGQANSVRAYIPNYATRFLECYAGYLQSVKSTKPEYYKDWYSKLVTDRFSLINMLVIINELVNVPGTANRFVYSPKVGEFQAALSEKYKTFEIEIGD